MMEFVRRQVELPEGTLPLYRAERTAKHHRGLVRKKVGVKYDQGEARQIAERSIRKEAAAKNRPADLINIALEKVVEAGLELPGFSTFDKMASKIRTEVNASIREGIHDRMSQLSGPDCCACSAGLTVRGGGPRAAVREGRGRRLPALACLGRYLSTPAPVVVASDVGRLIAEGSRPVVRVGVQLTVLFRSLDEAAL
ncbi:hypothetical protein CG724_11490 [Streptomyces sp. CB02120-2]|nr:hypothetical protein CG724_11490 [Streptomyces sp. CB02120-2]